MVESWKLIFTKKAMKDSLKLKESGLKSKAELLLKILEEDPFRNPPPFEKLIGDLQGTFSRRINQQHRLVYQIFPKERVIKVIRMWTHYE